jgi:hypothetical protein
MQIVYSVLPSLSNRTTSHGMRQGGRGQGVVMPLSAGRGKARIESGRVVVPDRRPGFASHCPAEHVSEKAASRGRHSTVGTVQRLRAIREQAKRGARRGSLRAHITSLGQSLRFLGEPLSNTCSLVAIADPSPGATKLQRHASDPAPRQLPPMAMGSELESVPPLE